MDNKINKQNIERLDIPDNAIEILKENSIKTIGQLCKKSKSDLRRLNLISEEIKRVEVELQLLGLNLKDNI